MAHTLKYSIAVLLCLLLNNVAIAQPENESQRGAYSAQQVRQARENAAMNRHHESLKPSGSSTSKTSNTSTSESYTPYQPSKYSEKARLQSLENQRLDRLAALQQQKAEQQQLFKSRKERFAMELVNKGITKTKENYSSIIAAAVSNNLPDTFYYAVFGSSMQEFEQKIISNDYAVNLYFPSASRMMRPTSGSYYSNYIPPQNTPVNNAKIPEYKKDTLQHTTKILEGLRLKETNTKMPADKNSTYNKLLIQPAKDSVQQNKNSIYKSLQLQ